jgi:hypothetical protein
MLVSARDDGKFVGLMQAGNTLQGPPLRVRGSNEEFSHVTIGVLGAALRGGIVLGSLLAGGLMPVATHVWHRANWEQTTPA